MITAGGVPWRGEERCQEVPDFGGRIAGSLAVLGSPTAGRIVRGVNPFEPVFRALNDAGVRYVIVGGFATVLHGHPRLTADIDLVLD